MITCLPTRSLLLVQSLWTLGDKAGPEGETLHPAPESEVIRISPAPVKESRQSRETIKSDGQPQFTPPGKRHEAKVQSEEIRDMLVERESPKERKAHERRNHHDSQQETDAHLQGEPSKGAKRKSKIEHNFLASFFRIVTSCFRN